MLARRALILLAAGGLLAACASSRVTPSATRWVLYTMQQQADGTQLWKPASAALDAEACRAEVRARADRGPIAPVGLIGWYRVPTGDRLWVGCLPEGYDPYERR